MKGYPSRSASMRPSVDLPAPRRPTSPMRCARSDCAPSTTRASIDCSSEGHSAGDKPIDEIDDAAQPLMAIVMRNECGERRFQRVGNRLQDNQRRVAIAAFDLRQIANRNPGIGGQLAPRDAPSGAAAPDQASDLGGEGNARRSLVARAGNCLFAIGLDGLWQIDSSRISTCTIMHVEPTATVPVRGTCLILSPHRLRFSGQTPR